MWENRSQTHTHQNWFKKQVAGKAGEREIKKERVREGDKEEERVQEKDKEREIKREGVKEREEDRELS